MIKGGISMHKAKSMINGFLMGLVGALVVDIAGVASFAARKIPQPMALPSFRLQSPTQKPLTPLTAPQANGSTVLTSSPPAQSDITTIADVNVYAKRLNEAQVELHIQWHDNVSCVAFQRGPRFIVAFDRPAHVDLSKANIPDHSFYRDVQPIVPQKDLTVLTFKLVGEPVVSVRQEGNDWVILFAKEGTPLPSSLKKTPLQLVPETLGDPAVYLAYTVIDTQTIHDLQDPDIGDRLFLIFRDQLAPVQGGTYIDYAILPSHAGIVLLAAADDLEVIKTVRGFKVGRSNRQPLHLSAVMDRERERKRAFPPPFFEFTGFYEQPRDWLQAQRNHLFKIFNNQGRKRLQARQDMVLFLLSTGYFLEAIANVDLMETENPDVKNDIQFIALKVMSAVLAHQPDRIETLLNTPPFRDEPEILLWKGVARLLDEKYHEGLQLIIQNIRYLSDYPIPVKNDVCLLAAHASYRLNYPGQFFIDCISKAYLSPAQLALYHLYAYQMDKRYRDVEKKRTSLALLRQSHHPRVQAEATLLLIDDNGLDLTEAIKTLEDLRFRWRGDDTEARVLTTLAELYEKAGNPYKALTYWEQLYHWFPHSSFQQQARERGQEILYKTFMGQGKEPVLSDYQAIALYFEFKELLPHDKRQEAMFDHLITLHEKLGLLARATTLLEKSLTPLEQSSTPPSTPQRATDITTAWRILHLGSLYLELGKTEKVLETLERIPENLEAMPGILQGKRFLHAKLLADQGQLDAGLSLLQPDTSLESLKLQADLCWQAQRWAHSAEIITKIIQLLDKDAKQRADYVLKLAVALALSHNVRGLELVKNAFGQFMAQSANREAFMIITSSADTVGGSVYQQSLAQLAASRTFNDFLQEFRKKNSLVRNMRSNN